MSLIDSEIEPFEATAFHNGKFVSVTWSIVFFYPADLVRVYHTTPIATDSGANPIEAAYLGAGESHETIARRFHLSRSAFFRRLQSATTRVGDELAARRQAIG